MMVIHSLAGGSAGGKGRGLAFLNALLTTLEYEKKYDSVEIMIPPELFSSAPTSMTNF